MNDQVRPALSDADLDALNAQRAERRNAEREAEMARNRAAAQERIDADVLEERAWTLFRTGNRLDMAGATEAFRAAAAFRAVAYGMRKDPTKFSADGGLR